MVGTRLKASFNGRHDLAVVPDGARELETAWIVHRHPQTAERDS
jgi:hypothetical protein